MIQGWFLFAGRKLASEGNQKSRRDAGPPLRSAGKRYGMAREALINQLRPAKVRKMNWRFEEKKSPGGREISPGFLVTQNITVVVAAVVVAIGSAVSPYPLWLRPSVLLCLVSGNG